MENQNNQVNEINIIKKPKSKFWKFALLFFATIVGVFILYLAGAWGWYFLQQWQGQKAVQELAENLERIKQQDYERAMADTYGGKTPQETLQMYISAIEKGDYELASKYFIEKYQEEWKNNLIEINKADKMDVFLVPLKEAIKSNGEYSENKDSFSIYVPVGVDLVLYPNGIWKIVRI